jgi:hypothetical protein
MVTSGFAIAPAVRQQPLCRKTSSKSAAKGYIKDNKRRKSNYNKFSPRCHGAKNAYFVYSII